MVYCFIDLDGTLISTKYNGSESDYMKVEMLSNGTYSYITKYAYDKLFGFNERNDVEIIPITTRSIEQYRNIAFMNFRYALVANGGVLIEDGEINDDWFNESTRMSVEADKDSVIYDCYYSLKADKDVIRDVDFVNGIFLYTKSSNPASTLNRLNGGYDISFSYKGEKLYVVPDSLSKKSAIKRFMNNRSGFIISAGDDSMLDYPMASVSDKFIFKDENNYYCDTVVDAIDIILNERKS